MLFLYIIAIPIIVTTISFFIFHGKINIKEMLCQLAVILIIMASLVFGFSASKKHDTEVLNGYVTGKTTDKVHCRHAYPCRCRTYKCGKSLCTHCDVCYMHNYDLDWNIHANYGMANTYFSINTIDLQGLKEPPRWTQFRVGDPYIRTHSYDNYVKANPDTIYKMRGYKEKFKGTLPEYPLSIYDYNTVLNRVLVIGDVKVPDIKEWNDELTKLNSVIGPQKQVNVLIILTSKMPEDYYWAIQENWIGGKKNDLIVFIDSTDGKINWVNAMAWAKYDILRVKLRDDILAIGKMDRISILNTINQDTLKHFKRVSMKEFKYLDKAIILTDSEFKWMFVIAILMSVALSFLFYKQDFFEY